MSLLFKKYLLNVLYKQYTLFYFLIAVLVQIPSVNANNNIKKIALSSLGDFKTSFSKVEEVSQMQGYNLIGKANYLQGKNYSVPLPFDVQRINYLVNNGSFIKKGESLAIVEGYDVHHFFDEYNSTKILLDMQKAHFQTNKQYFEKKAIKQSQWIEISKSYFETKLKFEHIQHLMGFIKVGENEQISLVSPINGIIQIPRSDNDKMSGDIAFNVIAKNDIYIEINTPISIASDISYFEINSACSLNIIRNEEVSNKHHKILWAKPVSNQCKLSLGQVIEVTPIRKIEGYKILKSAVFEFENKNYIAIKSNSDLVVTPIKIIGASEKDYFFESSEVINNKQVLISSVSILQGHLLNLGGD